MKSWPTSDELTGHRGGYGGRSGQSRGRRLAALLASAALLVAACGESGSEGSASSGGEGNTSTLKVGLVIPESGVYAALGQDMKAGFELYLEQHGNKLGGRPVELVIGDEGASPKEALPAIDRLLVRENVDVLTGIVNSAVAMAARDSLDRSKKLTLVSNAGADALTCAAGSPYIWRNSFDNGTDGASLGKHVAEQHKRVYIIAADYAAGREKTAGFVREFTKAGGEIAGESFTPFGTTRDFQPYLSAIKQARPDAVYAFYAGAETVLFVKQYDQFGLKGSIPLYGGNAVVDAQALEAQGESAAGVRTSSYYAPSLDNELNKAFVEEYAATTGGRATNVYALNSYDAAAVLDKALQATDGDSEGDALVAAMEQIGSIESPRGEFTFDDNRNIVQDWKLYEAAETSGGFENVFVEELGTLGQECAG
jgi:branched-chain amino acid transport system substrate-binding protein